MGRLLGTNMGRNGKSVQQMKIIAKDRNKFRRCYTYLTLERVQGAAKNKRKYSEFSMHDNLFDIIFITRIGIFSVKVPFFLQRTKY